MTNQTELERMYTTVDSLEVIVKTISDSPESPAAPAFYLSSGILTYAGKKSAALCNGLRETIGLLKSKSLISLEEAETIQVNFDDIFTEQAALCFAFLLGKHLNQSSESSDAKYIDGLKDALSMADEMFSSLSTTKRPALYLTRRVYSYADPARVTPAFDMFNTRILRSVLKGKDPMLEMASALLTPHMQAAFVCLSPDQLEEMSRALYVRSIERFSRA
jgi:hypothetical protein